MFDENKTTMEKLMALALMAIGVMLIIDGLVLIRIFLALHGY